MCYCNCLSAMSTSDHVLPVQTDRFWLCDGKAFVAYIFLPEAVWRRPRDLSLLKTPRSTVNNWSQDLLVFNHLLSPALGRASLTGCGQQALGVPRAPVWLSDNSWERVRKVNKCPRTHDEPSHTVVGTTMTCQFHLYPVVPIPVTWSPPYVVYLAYIVGTMFVLCMQSYSRQQIRPCWVTVPLPILVIGVLFV